MGSSAGGMMDSLERQFICPRLAVPPPQPVWTHKKRSRLTTATPLDVDNSSFHLALATENSSTTCDPSSPGGLASMSSATISSGRHGLLAPKRQLRANANIGGQARERVGKPRRLCQREYCALNSGMDLRIAPGSGMEKSKVVRTKLAPAQFAPSPGARPEPGSICHWPANASDKRIAWRASLTPQRH